MTVLALDAEQRRAVETVRGPLLVDAGPGSGKTRVVAERIANAIARRVVAPESVVAVTFTEKAAAQLLVRLRRLDVVATRPRGVRAATFHSAALRQLAYFWPRVIGSRAPDVLPSKLPVLIPIIQRLGGPLAGIAPADLAGEIEWVKAHGAGLSGTGEDSASDRTGVTSTEGPSLPGHLATVLLDGAAPRWVLDTDAYEAALRSHEGPLRRGVGRRFVAGLFAELFHAYETAKAVAGRLDFEDMLATCTALVRNVPEVRAAVRNRYTHFTVDEFQDVNRLQWDLLSAWTGESDDVCVVGDEDQAIYGFAGASVHYLAAFRARHRNATVVRLRRNYRSTQPVLDIAVAALSRRPGKRLEAVRRDGPSPILVECDDAGEERRRVVARCHALRATGVTWREMAVLYRTNAQSEAWEEAFGTAHIPFAVRGDLPFFRRLHITQALTVLTRAEQDREGVVRGDDPRSALDGAMPVPARLDRLVPRILRSHLSWSEREPEGDLARDRWADLMVLVELASEAYEASPSVTLGDFLAELRGRASLDEAPDGGGVNLLTLHRAKGLEFDAVFVVSVEEGRIPGLSAVARDERCGFDVHHPRSSVAEENRLLYVGLTRARTHLHISWVADGFRRPSRFLSGLASAVGPDANRLQRGQPLAPAPVAVTQQPLTPHRCSPQEPASPLAVRSSPGRTPR
ncbi:MAG: ATP-dependent helicase [Nitriliruptorales bacterium]